MDVGAWLRNLGLGQYEAAFRENSVDARVLPRLTGDDLKELGVTGVGHRRILLDAISELRTATVASGLPTEALVPPSSPRAAPPAKLSDVAAERRPITVMFCDLVGSTSLAAKLDPEDWRNLVNAYLDEASKAVTALGGHVLKKLGDGLMALFGYPQAQENDAERAVRAALTIQRALAEINAKNHGKGAPNLLARIGIESGPVVVEATGEVFGDAPNVAARVQAAAEPGCILITASVQRQVAGLFVAEEQGARELKGVVQPVQLFRIVRASGAGRRGGARALTPFVGREEELGVLARRWERARAGEGQLVLTVGEPGLGKSRLIEEFHTRLAETPHTWVEWSASQLLQNTPLHPIAEWGRLRFGVDAPTEQRLADLENTLRLIGLDPAEHAPLLAPLVDIPLPPERAASFAPEELRRRQLAAMTNMVLAGARSQPAVVAFEDLHWADPTSLDLLRALADRCAQAPLLLLATTRPEFRPAWSLRSHHSLISLSPLDRAGVARMVGEISAQHALSKEVIEGVSERTGGVPLFIEEVTRLLLERGEQGGVQAIPPTLQQSLAARLDRLGASREVAQIGAVLGRDFAYTLLRDIADLDEPALQASLDQLADADLLFIEGAPPQASYRFKHALIQDAAYDSLLKSRRQALHRRAAEILRDQPERAAVEPEVIAHHFTQAGLDDLAIEWWGKAGDQALRRSAFQEAIAHLGKAIEMTDKPEAGAAAPSQRLKLQTDYGQAVMGTKGYAAEETKAAFARVRELAVGTNDAVERFPAYYAQWVRSFNRGELRQAREIAEAFWREAEEGDYATEAGIGRRCLGTTCLSQGDLNEARIHLERALADYQPDRDGEARFRFGIDAGVAAATYLASASRAVGAVRRAYQLAEQAIQRAVELGHVPSSAHAYLFAADIARGEPAAALRLAEASLALAREHGMAHYVAMAEVAAASARGRLHDPTAGARELRRALTNYLELGNKLAASTYHGLLAELETQTRGPDSALKLIDQGLTIADETGLNGALPYLYRLRGEILLKRNPVDPAPAEEAFKSAIAIAKQQGARSNELLASLALAKLYQSTVRPAEAHVVLAPALEGFAPTPEMPEIAEAQALLGVLAETEEVKAAEAQRQSRLDLQTAYGHALMWGKGFAAEETKEAFSRVAEFAGRTESAAARFDGYYAQCLSSFVSGQFRVACEITETFLREAEAEGRATEACFARSMLGVILLNQGELKAARSVLERALADYDRRRDGEIGSRFWDPEVGAASFLAAVAWHLGDAERARELIDRAVRRAEELGALPTIVMALNWRAVLESQRHDVLATRNAAEAVIAVAEKHGVRHFAEHNWIYAHWARGRLHDPQEGADGLRQVLATFTAHGNKNGAPFFLGLLAELEATTKGAESALPVIDHALNIAEETGEHLCDPYLHGLRGDVLLRLDSSNPGPAKEAFRTAISIAKQQGARSWGLRAALSLAKLYQSTARPLDAHAVLVPALEGFAPTPEMPEIVEAQALLAALAETDEVKNAAAQRDRRLHLQTAYGQALMYSRGFGSDESKTAFARARTLTAAAGDASERFDAYYGLLIGSVMRGELSLARETAESFLRDAENEGRMTEASVALRNVGAVRFYQGDLIGGRTNLGEALRIYDPQRDRDAKFRFGVDTGAAAMGFVALVGWALGDVERARALSEEALARADETAHAPTRAFVHRTIALYQMLRCDLEAARRTATIVVDLGREHGMALWLAAGEMDSKFARAWLSDRESGMIGLRDALAAYLAQGNKLFVPLFQGWLAELEAEGQDADGSLRRIEEALALANKTGEHWNDALLHRIRGAVLLKRDPANPAPAEEAFLAAIAIAQAQKARSFELQAALALAKLYQSTARAAEAHAVLAPALEAFSPSPEMPEVAEGQAMLAHLGDDDKQAITKTE
jgi:class 3 adenylate cyclase/predicted ATPase